MSFQIQLLEYFPQKQKEQRQKHLGTDKVVKFRSLYFANLATLKSRNSYVDNLLKDTAETESEVVEKSVGTRQTEGKNLA
jgi:hypothetical protein